MKVSYQWLNEYLPLEKNQIEPSALAEKLALTSVDINEVYSPSDGLSNIVVGQIESVTPHPDSDHLNLCQVKISEGAVVQIVCGAPNVSQAAGKKVIVALAGAKLKDGTKIKRGKIRGEESNGMLCALQEIGFSDKIAPKAYEEGIWFLPDDAKVGDAVFGYLGMDDTIIDTDLTPNRGDMLSMYGNVNDLSAIYDLPNNFVSHDVKENGTQKAADMLKITIPDPQIAPAYKARVIKNVKLGESPMWLQIRLWNAGIRPINNVVDVTNYILLKYGQPMHSYDYDRLPAHELSVRHAHEGEKFVTLDEAEQTLQKEDIVVTSNDEPVCLAGTMGGLNTAVSDQTQNVVLEAAIFDSVMVRKQARRLDLHSESSMRFERGVNPETVETALNEAAYWLQQLAGGEVEQGIVTGSEAPIKSTPITMSLTKINAVLGTDLKLAQVENIFDRLKFAYTQSDDDTLVVSVPARRWDISIAADLNEEIARLYGFNNIPSTLPTMTRTLGGLNERQKFLKATRHSLQSMGLNQAISYSLMNEKQAQQFTIEPAVEPMQLDYPMSSDHTTARESIISSLLVDVAYNTTRQVEDIALYEQGRVFIPKGGERPEEQEHVAGAMAGSLLADSWNLKRRPVDFYQIKGIVERYLHNMAIAGTIEYVADSTRPEMHPGRTANILLNGKLIGFVGQVHPQMAKDLKIPATYVFELNVEALLAADKLPKQYRHISKYPAVTRDIALLIDEDVTNEEIVDLIYQKGGQYLKDVHLFDVYTGAKLPDGKKSLAYTLTYQADDTTLTEDQVNEAFARVEKHLQNVLNAEIR